MKQEAQHNTKFHPRAKKSLGQHFLTSQQVVHDMIRAAQITSSDTVLEVGPGKGKLTKALLEVAERVVVVEKDDRLIPLLKETFAHEIAEGRLALIHDDALDISVDDYLKGPYKVVANIPYYITGHFIRTTLEQKHQPVSMTLLVQKEVAERIVARAPARSMRKGDGKESLLSIGVKAYGTPTIVRSVPARFFSPPPKVASAVLHIKNISRDFFHNCDEEMFFTLLRAAFAHKRKKLASNIKEVSQHVPDLSVCGISPHARAEDVSLAQWKCLSGYLQ